MSTMNTSTSFTPFQLRLGHAPCVIPPIVPYDIPEDLHTSEAEIINHLREDEAEVWDNLIQAKATQAFHANTQCQDNDVFQIGDQVMLSTLNHRWEYKKKGEKRSAKFFP